MVQEEDCSVVDVVLAPLPAVTRGDASGTFVACLLRCLLSYRVRSYVLLSAEREEGGS